MYRRIIGVLVVVIGLFFLMVGFYKSFPAGPWGKLPTPQNPIWLWVDKLMPPASYPSDTTNWPDNCVYVVLLVAVGYGIFLTVGGSPKATHRAWEK